MNIRSVLKNPLLIIAVVILFAVIVITLFGPMLAPHDPVETDLSVRFSPPSMKYPLGNDSLGRCLFSRILCGARMSIGLGITVVLFSSLLGVTAGLISGYCGGFVDELIMRIVDIFFAFPEIVAAMAVAGLMGPGTLNLLFALSFVSWTRYARLVRGITLSVRERDYIKAAQLSGVSRTVIIIRHILPANLSSIIVLATIGLAKAILAVSALGFLGFGIQPPHPEWGTLLMEGKDYILSAPHLSLYPGIAIMLSVLSFNLIGDALRDIRSHQC
ncbi:MAG: ABC transporter permease subunit [Desulfobacterales bacterium]|nr:ABC transporter permease subunit [Desulfobacterales bacterium]